MLNNLFITKTPYQYLSAINICNVVYSSKEFYNEIYFFPKDNNSVFYESKENSLPFNGIIRSIGTEEKISFYKSIRKNKYERVFFFQENDILNKYVSYHLKKQGTIICLGPDGTKPYAVFDKSHELLSMLKDTNKDYMYLIKNNLLFPRIFWSRYYRYGASKIIDEVWLQHPELFDKKKNKTKGELIKMPELENSTIEIVKKTMVGEDMNLPDLNKCIIYFNQPIWSKKLIDKEIEILNFLSNHHNTLPLYLKLHPLTPEENLKRIKEVKGINIIYNKIPAEVYINHAKDSIMLTPWSTALMHVLGERNKYYYLYPEFQRVNDYRLNQINLIPFPHLQVLNNIEDL
ncbi:hypothetical protein GCM10007424_10020 [Flavobacterium suaedae]|uniref:Uncharacterized protein n=1 Tax=Flavobacterium suaedae TaxID=1767027 RepID=A0ABQ1JPS6_9FLAO|nr:hypothetical protein [Flavobacterium suaedae]GGB72026.1 hypothetical protein GCM10007424_10020 [Flavobacterium suaedae]